jgi:hypothetical protein
MSSKFEPWLSVFIRKGTVIQQKNKSSEWTLSWRDIQRLHNTYNPKGDSSDYCSVSVLNHIVKWMARTLLCNRPANISNAHWQQWDKEFMKPASRLLCSKQTSVQAQWRHTATIVAVTKLAFYGLRAATFPMQSLGKRVPTIEDIFCVFGAKAF